MIDFGMIIVLFIRLLGPLLMFIFPLAGGLLSEFLFDTLDAPLWDFFGSSAILSYVEYDKLLDMYQLIIMGIIASTWKQKTVNLIGFGLFGIRLCGYILFEFTGERMVFLFFPNIFVLFYFSYYILLRTKKGHLLSNKKFLLGLLVILFLVKLPQEYLLHYSEVQFWEMLKVIL